MQHPRRGRRSRAPTSSVSSPSAPSNVASDSSILEAIDYAITTAHVNVLNESFGINNYPDDIGSLDLIAQADDQAVAAGITVVEAAAGDALV